LLYWIIVGVVKIKAIILCARDCP